MNGSRLLAGLAIGCTVLATAACKDSSMGDTPRPEVTRPAPGGPGAMPPPAPGGSATPAPGGTGAPPADSSSR